MLRDIRFLLKARYSGSRALVIGIDKYAHGSPLSYAGNDAEGMYHVLTNDLKFPSSDVTLLKDEKATKTNILRAYLGYTSGDVNVDDRIIIFFAGHGLTKTGVRGEVGFLVPHDGKADDLSTLIRWEEFTKSAEMVRAKHLLFIMDVCYGGLALTRHLGPGSSRFLKDMMLRYARQAISAGKADEVVADSGGPLPNHSVFTGHLLEGLRGKAFTQEGILTANGLMSYVQNKVSADHNSCQTPHYGCIDGDGDMIICAPQLTALEEDEQKDIDTLVVLPYPVDDVGEDSVEPKIAKVKGLLGTEAGAIELHDVLVNEVRDFLARTSISRFPMQGPVNQQAIIDRISKYDDVVNDLSMLVACLAFWARPIHKPLLQKILSRSTDGLDQQNGITTWLELRWYPIVIELYCSGIAAIAARRFDSLAAILYSRIPGSMRQQQDRSLAEGVAEAMLELTRAEIFKKLPGHEQHFTPISEYLFKNLQPRLDDALFLGQSYESVFDEFETLFALVVADLRKQRNLSVWCPIGRFGWKSSAMAQARFGSTPIQAIIAEAQTMGADWEVLKAGLFGGNQERFEKVAGEVAERIGRLGWY